MREKPPRTYDDDLPEPPIGGTDEPAGDAPVAKPAARARRGGRPRTTRAARPEEERPPETAPLLEDDEPRAAVDDRERERYAAPADRGPIGHAEPADEREPDAGGYSAPRGDEPPAAPAREDDGRFDENARDRQEPPRTERPRFDRDRFDRERGGRDRFDRDRSDRDRVDRDRDRVDRDRDQVDRDRDRDRVDRDRDRSDPPDRDRDRSDRDRVDRDRPDRDRFDRDRGRFDRGRHDRDRDRDRDRGRFDRDRFGRGERDDRDRDRGGAPAEPPPPPPERPRTLSSLQAMKVDELEAIAVELGIPAAKGRKKYALLAMIMEEQVRRAGRGVVEGILELLPDGYGFVRCNSWYAETGDAYVSTRLVKEFGLRTGDAVLGFARRSKESEKFPALVRVDSVNDDDPARMRGRKVFEKQVPLYPDSMLDLEVIGEADISCRVMNLFCPVGRGQRGLIVAPPKAGKTTLLKAVANAITTNHPEVTLMVLLIDERPEEVTDMQRSIDGEVISSTFDEPIERHIQVSKLILEKAKRLVEMDRHVVILLDSITRLARAYNLVLPSTGQTLSGGVNPAALYLPKKFFGAARNLENGGSLTIIATALVDTGSRLDDVIFEEFKGTGNLELVLDRKLFEKRIFPCMDIKKTGTRKEELLLDKETLRKLWVLRKIVDPLSPAELMQLLIDRIGKTKTNAEFLSSMHNQEA